MKNLKQKHSNKKWSDTAVETDIRKGLIEDFGRITSYETRKFFNEFQVGIRRYETIVEKFASLITMYCHRAIDFLFNFSLIYFFSV